MKDVKLLINLSIFKYIKFLLFLLIILQIKYGTKYLKKPDTTRNLILNNLKDYNMVRFVDYDYLDFNSIEIFRYFRKKYFNINNIKYNYDEANNKSKIEYDFEIYDENQTLIETNSIKKNMKITCVPKETKNFKNKVVLEIYDEFCKCIVYFNSTDKIKFGFRFTQGRKQFNAFFYFNEILDLNKSKNINQT